LKQLTLASSLIVLLMGGGALAQTPQSQNAAKSDYCSDGFAGSAAPQNGMMTKEQVHQMADHEFAAMDRNSDGRVSPIEFSSCIARAGSGVRPAEIKGGKSTEADAAFHTADANSDDELNSREYLAAAEKEFGQQSAASGPDAVPVFFIWVPASVIAAPARSGSQDAATTADQAAAHAAMAFEHQDSNADGTVSVDEWTTRNSGISPDLIETHFKLLDANGDGVVTKDEYAAKWADRFNKAQQAQGSAQGDSVPVWLLYVR